MEQQWTFTEGMSLPKWLQQHIDSSRRTQKTEHRNIYRAPVPSTGQERFFFIIIIDLKIRTKLRMSSRVLGWPNWTQRSVSLLWKKKKKDFMTFVTFWKILCEHMKQKFFGRCGSSYIWYKTNTVFQKKSFMLEYLR